MTRQVRNSSGLVPAVSLVFFFASICGGDRAFGEDETLRRSFPLSSGGRISVENTRGNIRISSWDQNRVEIVAEKKGDSREDMELVPIQIDSRDDEIKINSLFPEYAPDLYVTVDYRLRVPRDVDLKLVSTVNGEIEVSEVNGRAILLTDHGPITVKKFSGLLKAESLAYGAIDVELTQVERRDHIVLQNINGEISVRLPKEVEAFWIVRTLNGKIDSDIPFDIGNSFGPQVAHHPNEGGDPLVRAYSVNGDIRIEQR